jgi:hypothetical protein
MPARTAQHNSRRWNRCSKGSRHQPIPGAFYGSFAGAHHYADGQFVPGPEATCTPAHPASGAAFFFRHPDLITLHVWLWYPNPAGIFNDTNPLTAPRN